MKKIAALLLAVGMLPGAAAAQRPNEPLKIILVKAGRILDVRAGAYRESQGILIEAGKIKQVGPYETVRAAAPREVTVLDLGTATVLPGLIDCHAHLLASMTGVLPSDSLTMAVTTMSLAQRALLGARNAREDLEAGVTTVRNVGHSGINGDSALRDAVEAGWIPGPRIQAATRKLSPPGGQALPLHSVVASAITDQEFRVVAGADDARRAVREALHEGADLIKLVIGDLPPRLGPDEIKAIVDEAHRSKIKVAVHAVTAEAIALAIDGGVDSIEHADEATDEQLKAMRARGIFLGATEWTRQALFAPFEGRLTPAQQAGFDAYFKSFSEKSARRLRRAMELGVKIAAGSDMWFLYPGKTRGEATVLVLTSGLRAEGMPAPDVIRSMTLHAAELLGWQDRVGTLEPGKYADLIAVSGDPLQDIAELEHVRFVMKGGRVVKNELPAGVSFREPSK